MKKKLFTAFNLALATLCAVVSIAQDAPKQAMREVPFTNVKLSDNYWAPRIEANRLVSIPHNIKWCETETGRINNFKIAGGLQEGEFSGIYFDDSDVYKIVEGFAYSLADRQDPELKKKADEWKEVKTNDKYSCVRDRDVVVNFEEINASKVRIVAQLKENYPGGILRWIVK